jgi:hypothetical protein
MSSIDDLLREFRADVPGPAEGAQQRILERARSAAPRTAPGDARPPRGRRWSRTLRWAVLPVSVAVAASLFVAISPTKDDAPTLLQRAEAAISGSNRIVELSTTVRSDTNARGVVNPHRTIKMRQWTLAGAGQAMQFRILITEGPLDKPPTDEDSTVLADRTGRVVDQRTWTPLHVRARDNYDYPRGGGRGELEILRPEGKLQGPLTLVDRLREAYRSDRVKPTGRTAGGDLRFRLDFGGCSRMDFVLDAQTLLPRRIVNTDGVEGCGTSHQTTSREVSTIGVARTLPAVAANRRLLEIGDWPTARIVQEAAHGEPKPIAHVPPVPKLDEG